MNDEQEFKLQKPLYVKCSKEITSFPLSFDKWNYIKKQIQDIELNNWSNIIGGGIIGAGLSTIASLFTTALDWNVKILWIVIFIFVSILGAVLIHIGKNPFSKKERVLPYDIIKYMTFIEKEIGDNEFTVIKPSRQNVFLKEPPPLELNSPFIINDNVNNQSTNNYIKETKDEKESSTLIADRPFYANWNSQNKNNKIINSSLIKIMDDGIVWCTSPINYFNIIYNVRVNKQIRDLDRNSDIRFYIASEIDSFPRIVFIFPWEFSELNPNKFECHIDYETKGYELIRLRQISVCDKTNKSNNIEYNVDLNFSLPNLIFKSTLFDDPEGISIFFDEIERKGFHSDSSKYIGFYSKNSQVIIKDILIKEIINKNIEDKEEIAFSNNYIKINSGILQNRGVKIEAFYISQYPITNKEFVEFLNSQGNQFEGVYGKDRKRVRWMGTEKENISSNWDNAFCGIEEGTKPGTFRVKDDYKYRPIIYITWYGAVAYCNWLSEKNGFQKCYGERNNREKLDLSKNGFRLPLQDEWELACQAGNYKKYYWGDEINNAYCWYGSDVNGPQPVGKKNPNGFGLYDMSGHIWQWTNSKEDDRYILRGGTFSKSATIEQCSSEYSKFLRFPTEQMGDFGFRIVRNK